MIWHFDNLKAISEIVIDNKNYRSEKINYLISKFELDSLKDIKAKFLSGGQKISYSIIFTKWT